MAITVDCPECDRSYRVGSERAGSRIRCRNCGCPIRVPPAGHGGGSGPPIGLWIAAAAVTLLVAGAIGLTVVLLNRDSTNGTAGANGDADDNEVAWQVEPDPQPAAAALLPAGRLTLQPRTRFEGVAFSSAATGQAYALLQNPQVDPGKLILRRFDLRTQNFTDQLELVLDRQGRLLAASPNGQYCVVRKGITHPLELWEWSPRGPVKRLELNINGVGQSAFVTDDRLLMAQSRNHILCMNHKTKEMYFEHREVLSNGKFTLSPGRRYFFAYKRRPGRATEPLKLRIFDAESGAVAGLLEQPSARISSLHSSAFALDGRVLAAIASLERAGLSATSFGTFVLRWDISTGKLISEFAIENQYPARLQWVDTNYLLSDDLLIDLEREAVVWKYRYEDKLVDDPPDMRVWLVQSGDPCILSAQTVPSAVVTGRINGVLDNSAPPILMSGGRVAIEVRGIGAPDFHREMLTALSEKLQQQQITLDADSPLTIVATIREQTGSGSTTFTTPGRGSSNSFTASNDRLVCDLMLVDQTDHVHWKDRFSAGVGTVEFVDPNGDPSQELAARRWTRIRSFLENYKFPEKFYPWTGRAGAGSSKLSADGDSEVQAVRQP